MAFCSISFHVLPVLEMTATPESALRLLRNREILIEGRPRRRRSDHIRCFSLSPRMVPSIVTSLLSSNDRSRGEAAPRTRLEPAPGDRLATKSGPFLFAPDVAGGEQIQIPFFGSRVRQHPSRERALVASRLSCWRNFNTVFGIISIVACGTLLAFPPFSSSEVSGGLNSLMQARYRPSPTAT